MYIGTGIGVFENIVPLYHGRRAGRGAYGGLKMCMDRGRGVIFELRP